MMMHHTSDVLRAVESCEGTDRRLCVLFSHQKNSTLLSSLTLMCSTGLTRAGSNLESQRVGATPNKRATKGKSAYNRLLREVSRDCERSNLQNTNKSTPTDIGRKPAPSISPSRHEQSARIQKKSRGVNSSPSAPGENRRDKNKKAWHVAAGLAPHRGVQADEEAVGYIDGILVRAEGRRGGGECGKPRQSHRSLLHLLCFRVGIEKRVSGFRCCRSSTRENRCPRSWFSSPERRRQCTVA